MTTTSSCPGCSRSTRGRTPACSPCVERLPEHLQRALTANEHALAQTHDQAIAWLSGHPRLSDRELQVLHLVAEGRRDDDIAQTLSLSVNTIRDHLKRVSRRLGCTGRAHLMATAYRKGYLGETTCVG